VRSEAPTVRRRLAEYNPAAHRCRAPPSFGGHLWRQAPIAVDTPDQALDVDDRRLQLDHQEGTRSAVEAEDVDDTPLTVDRERRFGNDEPFGPSEVARNDLVEGRVTSIQHPIQIAAAPPRVPSQPDLEHPRDPLNRSDRQEPHVATLDA
jgi:hypothetical protein